MVYLIRNCFLLFQFLIMKFPSNFIQVNFFVSFVDEKIVYHIVPENSEMITPGV